MTSLLFASDTAFNFAATSPTTGDLRVYFLPTFLAGSTQQRTFLFWLNLVMGWTSMGWLGPLPCSMKRLPVSGLLALLLLATQPQAVQAQARPLPYGAVDQLPQLPSGGGTKALEAALVRSFRYPTQVQPAQVNGHLDLEAVVTPAGKITTVTVTRSWASANVPTAVDEAVRAAFHRLPLLTPGRLAGKPVAVRLDATWSFSLVDSDKRTEVSITIASNEREENAPDLSGLSSESASPAESTEPVANRVYTYVEEMPHLVDSKGLAPIVQAIVETLVVPANTEEGRVFVRFVVTELGAVSEPSIVKGIGPTSDAAVLAAVKRLPAFIPGRQNSRPVRVELLLPITIRRPSK
jgi:outer membrane biosynthesis protein TonB